MGGRSPPRPTKIFDGLSTKEIISSLKTLDVNDKCVSKVVTTCVSHNVAFVMDVSSKFVGHVKKLLSDDMGAWNQTGTKTVNYKLNSGDFEVVTNFPPMRGERL